MKIVNWFCNISYLLIIKKEVAIHFSNQLNVFSFALIFIIPMSVTCKFYNKINSGMPRGGYAEKRTFDLSQVTEVKAPLLGMPKIDTFSEIFSNQ